MYRDVLVLALLAALAFAGWQTLRLRSERAAHAQTRATFAEERADYHREAARAVTAARAEEQRRTLAAEEITRDTQNQLVRLQVDIDRARAERNRLRQQLAEFVERAGSGATSGDTAAAGQCTGQPDPDAPRVLAELLERADARAENVGLYADRLRIAGEACERRYDTLMTTTTTTTTTTTENTKD